MKESKLYLQVSVEEEPPKDDEFYHTNEGKCRYQPANECWFDIRGDYANPEYWLKPLPLTLSELMVGFAEWCEDNFTRHCNAWIRSNIKLMDDHSYWTEELLVIYLTEQKIIIK